MREIKFRAWDKNDNKFIYKDLVDIYELIEQLNYSIKEFNEKKESYILMQSTGLKDKNGVEIYEGDILAEVGAFKHYIDRDGITSDKKAINCTCKIIESYDFIRGIIKERILIGDLICGSPVKWIANEDECGFSPFNNCGCCGITSDQIIVVGNIYENPDLLITNN